MSDINDDYVRELAYLARINLTDDEVDKLKPQLASILAYVEQLDKVDTTGLPATSQVTGLTHIARGDEEQTDTMGRDELLDQTQAKQDGQVRVPKVI